MANIFSGSYKILQYIFKYRLISIFINGVYEHFIHLLLSKANVYFGEHIGHRVNSALFSSCLQEFFEQTI